MTGGENTESPDTKKVTDSFIKYYQKWYEKLEKEKLKKWYEINEIYQDRNGASEKDPRIEKLSKEMGDIDKEQIPIQETITRLNFPPEQKPEG